MSLIPPQRRVERQAVTIKVEVPVFEAWKHYSEFINSSQEHVANRALYYLFTHDETFVGWRRSKYPDARLEDELDKAEQRRARRSTRRARGSRAHEPQTA